MSPKLRAFYIWKSWKITLLVENLQQFCRTMQIGWLAKTYISVLAKQLLFIVIELAWGGSAIYWTTQASFSSSQYLAFSFHFFYLFFTSAFKPTFPQYPTVSWLKKANVSQRDVWSESRITVTVWPLHPIELFLHRVGSNRRIGDCFDKLVLPTVANWHVKFSNVLKGRCNFHLMSISVYIWLSV